MLVPVLQHRRDMITSVEYTHGGIEGSGMICVNLAACKDVLLCSHRGLSQTGLRAMSIVTASCAELVV